MLLAQPNTKFGDQLCRELNLKHKNKRKWSRFDFAVAWMNQSGAMKIYDSLKEFLNTGGEVRAIVGLDFSSTSYEGLTLMLDLSREGSIQTNVFFDENRGCTFHPKLYLFTNNQLGRLYVGSNNMTGAGLDTNVEVSLQVTKKIDDDTIKQALTSLEAWSNEEGELRTRSLTYEFLDELKDKGYVQTEKEIRKTRQSDSGKKMLKSPPLFGRSKISRATGTKDTSTENKSGDQEPSETNENVLLMRVKPRRNGKQVQFSMRVFEHPFMNGTSVVLSAANNTRREIGFNNVMRNGESKRNTARFEAPELHGIFNPVARLKWVSMPEKVLQYEIFDGNDNGEGSKIFRILEQGIGTPPNTRLAELSSHETVLSKSDPDSAQWYRLA